MRQITLGLASGTLACALAFTAYADPPPPPAAAATPPQATAPAVATLHIPAETRVVVELADGLSSRTNHIGDTFRLRLAEPVLVDGQVALPAGVMGGGEVLDAAPSGFGGRPAKLILVARFLDIGGQHIRLHGMQLTAIGQDNVNGALAASFIPYAGIASIFIHGGEIDTPIGARGNAKLGADVDVAPGAITAPHEDTSAAVAAPTSPQTESGENHQ